MNSNDEFKPKRKFIKKVSPVQLLALGYFFTTVTFTLLLMLPVSSKTGISQNPIDALFIAASGISTTGLVVMDPGSFYSLFGQIVLLLNFQIGGLGYMVFFVYIANLFEKNLSLHNRLVAGESVAGAGFGPGYEFFSRLIMFTVFFEVMGAVILFFCWFPAYPAGRALYLGIFHSVSAFCTAGFTLFPDSLMSYRANIAVNTTINLLSLVGGIGFYVLNELYMVCKKILMKGEYKRISLHTRMALSMTGIVIAGGIAVITISENWPVSYGIGERFLAASFQAISASTTDGFNTVDIGAMSFASLFYIILLMFIGASPGSTGGGIKTTTLGVIVMNAWCKLRGKKDSSIFERRIPETAVDKAHLIFFMFLIVAVFDMLFLTNTEKAGFLQIFFECISALGNTGLSTGITAGLSSAAKILLSLTMFIGRVGPLTLGLALVSEKHQSFRYPEGTIFVS